jgi:prepilin-type N-terminal cleavage/methylation domain-containing protein
MTRRRGFTLVEVLIALILTLAVAGIALRFLLRQHWSGRAQAEAAATQSSLRAGLLFLASELRELGGTAGNPDIVSFAAESLTYRAMRGHGVSCDRADNSVSLSIGFSGYRAIQAGRDSLLMHQEAREDVEADDRWVALPVLAISGGGTCPPASQLLTTVLDTMSYRLSDFSPLAPVRTFEVMQLKLYQSGSDYWLGVRSVSAGETIQPLIGPLTSNGLSLGFQDSTGAPAARPDDIRSIGVTLRVLSTNPVRTGGGFGPAQRRVDSLSTSVFLRNW